MISLRNIFGALARMLGIDGKQGAASKSEQDVITANFGAIVANGLFFPTAGKLLGAGLLLTWFVSELTPSAFVVGLLVPIQYGVALLAQPWIAQWISGRPARVPYYRNQALFRGLLWGAFAAAVVTMDDQPGALLAIFFVIVTADAVAAGVGNIAFSDALARVIPQSLRGRARGGRGMAGAIVAGAAGIAVNQFVSPDSGLGTFALLFAVAAVCYALGGLTFGVIAEPKSSKQDRVTHDGLGIRVREMFAAPGYRRFLAVQMLLLPATHGLVFFTLFGRREFHLDLKALGLLIISDALAPLVGNYFWGKWADRLGNRWVLGSAAVVSVVAPALALALVFAGADWPSALILAAFGGIVFVVGVASTGVDLATKNFVLELAPDELRRPVYIGVNDALVAIPTMLLAGGGIAIDRLGFLPVFVACTVCSVVAAVLCGLLKRKED